jgi:hypothetical protein
MTAFVIERGDLRRDSPLGVGADPAGEDDDLALVALDVFEIFDEDRLMKL